MLRAILLCSYMLLFAQLTQQQDTDVKEAPVIETTLGRIRGSVLTSRKGRDIYSYRGIHYAKAPTGQRRFAAPEPVEPWSDTLDALTDGPWCPQADAGNARLDEDCLTLNVFTTDVTSTNPVIFYISGGANIHVSADSIKNARPDYLLDDDVVLVSVFFRVGSFGFLSTGTQAAPGNYGYLDQVLALKWVKQHIEKFGGNPNKVTLMGYSAGSMAVTSHLVSPLSAGLFHRAIAGSGSTTNHAEINNVRRSRILADDLGCPKYGPQYLLNCLRQLSWQQIVEVSARWEINGLGNMKWSYEIDGNFLMEHPIEAVRNNRFNRVPIITGVTINEFDFDPNPTTQNNNDLIDDINENFGLYVPDVLDFETTGNDDERAKSLREFYFNTTSINRNSLENLGRMKSDCIIGHNVYRLVELAKDYTDVYFYRFDYVGEISRDRFGNLRGVSHGDDRNYYLPNQNLLLANNSSDIFMVERMVKLFSSFAADGAPPAIENITWPPYTANNSVVMYIDKNLYTGEPFYLDRYALWNRLFPLKESSAAIQIPAIVLPFVAAVWGIFL